jgi:hypothetical protein
VSSGYFNCIAHSGGALAHAPLDLLAGIEPGLDVREIASGALPLSHQIGDPFRINGTGRLSICEFLRTRASRH